MARRSFLAVTALLLVVFSVPVCVGQRNGGFRGGSSFSAGFHSGRSGFGRQSFGRHLYDHGRGDYSGAYLLGDPFFWYGDDAPQVAPDSGPPVVILRPDTAPQAKLTPLLIELEGDRYVRHGGTAPAQGEPSAGPRTSPAPKSGAAPRQQSVELAPTLLIFRDGHREQIADYAIVGRVVYAHGDFDGEPNYGLKNIQLSGLDLATTIKVNRENGVSFVLPSGPNEVVTRP